MSSSQSNSGIVLELAEEFLERYRQGERPSLQEYIDKHPNLADEIRDVFPAMAMMENIALADESLAGKLPAGAPLGEPPGSSRRALPLQQLGDYRIIREVGHGGMGIVYEAEQISLGRHVALKVLPKKMLLDAKLKRRFEREAKAAAKLHHTNIVPVFGVGEEDGLPYYVMQFIQGLGLDEVMDELKRMQRETGTRTGPFSDGELRVSRKDLSAAHVARSLMTGEFEMAKDEKDSNSLPNPSLSHGRGSDSSKDVTADVNSPAPASSDSASSSGTGRLSDSFSVSSSSITLPVQSESVTKSKAKRLTYWQSVARIGTQVAEALEYAHKQGILHRDVKPSNLLLDTRGTVWVTDFGLAKVVNSTEEGAANLTHTGDILGTLRYMPPEAFEGRSDARSEIYSLGLTLYEMIALQPAFGEKDRHRLIKQVMNEEPPRLKKLNREVPRDLETIIHKAIDRDPARRYQTAQELADDLERFIEDEPIRARRTTLPERFARWCRRNKMVASLTVAIAALLLLVAFGSTLAAFRFGHLADQERTARTAAEAAQRREAEERKKAEEAQQREAEQRVEADRQHRRAEEGFGKARAAVNDYLTLVSESQLLKVPGLQPLRRDLLNSALNFYQEFVEKRDDDPTLRRELAAIKYRIAKIYLELGSPQRKAALDEAITLYEQLAKKHADDADVQHGLALCYLSAGASTKEKDRRHDAIAIWEKLLIADPDNPRYQEYLAEAFNSLATRSTNDKDHGTSLQYHQKALKLRAAVVRAEPDNPKALSDLGGTMNNIGVLLSEQGRHADALDMYHQGVKYDKAAFDMAPEVIQYGRYLAIGSSNVGIVENKLGRADEAEHWFRYSAEVRKRIAAANPEVAFLQIDALDAYRRLADHQRKLGKTIEAADSLRLAQAVIERLPKQTGNDLVRLAKVYALASVDLAKRQQDKMLDDEEEEESYDNESRLFADQAMNALRDALAAGYTNFSHLSKDNDLKVLRLRQDFQTLLGQMKKADAQAKAAAKKSKEELAFHRNLAMRQDLALTAYSTGVLNMKLGQLDAAAELLGEALKMRHELEQDEPKNLQHKVNLARTYTTLAELSAQQGRSPEKLKWWQKAVAVADTLPTNHSEQSLLRRQFADLLLESAEQWEILRPEYLKSKGGATLTLLEDGSIIVSGKDPSNDEYTLKVKTKMKGITALKLEVIPDASLPSMGSGRGKPNGNFHLRELTLKVEGKPVTWSGAAATYSQLYLPVNHAIDGNPQTVWGVGSRTNHAHYAVFELVSPVGKGNQQELTIGLMFKDWHRNPHNLGRFRLSVTKSPKYRSLVQTNLVQTKANGWLHQAAAHAVLREDKAAQHGLEQAANAGKLVSGSDLLLAAFVQNRLGRHQDARRSLEQAIEWMKHNDVDEALHTLIAVTLPPALAHNPDDARLLALYGHWLGLQGKTTEAIALITKAAKLAPDDKELQARQAQWQPGTIAVWNFDFGMEGWRRDGADVQVKLSDGVLHVTKVGNTPRLAANVWAPAGFMELTFRARVKERITAELLWSTTSRTNMGHNYYQFFDLLPADGDWREHKVYFQAEDNLTTFQLRLGTYLPDAEVEIDWITLRCADAEAVLARFNKALQADPNNNDLLLQRADLFYAMKKWKEAIADYDRLIAAEADDVYLLLRRGTAGLLGRLWQQADADYTRLVKLVPDNEWWWMRLGQARREQRRWPEAIAAYDKLLKINPKHHETLVLRARAWDALRDFDKALKDYNTAIKLRPDYLSYASRASHWAWREEPQKAADDMLNAAKLNSNLGWWQLRNSSLIFLFNRDKEKFRQLAEEYFHQHSAIDHPGVVHRWLARVFIAAPELVTKDNLPALLETAKRADRQEAQPLTAALHLRIGDHQKAADLFAAHRGGNMAFRFLEAMAYHKLGDKEKTFQSLEQGHKWVQQKLAMKSGLPANYWEDWAFILILQREAIELISADVEKALADNPDKALPLVDRARLRLALGQHKEAATDLDKAIKLQPEAPEAWMERGRWQLTLGQHKEAVADLSKSIERRPKYYEALRLRAQCWETLGEMDKVLEDYNQLIAIEPDYSLLVNRADLWALRGEWHKAAADYANAAKFGPITGWGHFRSSALLFALTGDKEKFQHAAGEFLQNREVSSRDRFFNPWLLRVFVSAPDLVTKDNLPLLLESVKKTSADHQPHFTAALHLRLGEPQKAVDLFAANPGGGMGFHFLAALAHQQLGHRDKAIELLEQGNQWMQEQRDANPEAAVPFYWPTWAYLLILQREAIELVGADLDKAIKADPKNAGLHLDRARLFAALQRHKEALADVSKAMKLEPNKLELFEQRGDLYVQMKKWHEAAQDFTHAADLKKDDADLYLKAGRAFAQAEMWDRVAANFVKAIDLLPPDEGMHAPRAKASLELAQWDKAFSKTTELQPENTLLWIARGRHHLLRSRWKEAAADFAKVMEQRRVSEHWYEYAALLLLADDVKGYQQFCARFIKEHGQTNSPYLAYTLARSCVLVPQSPAQPQQIIEWAKQAVDERHTGWHLHVLGAAYYRAGDYQQAVKHLQQSNETGWGDRYLNSLFLAMSHHKLGNADEAQKWLTDATRQIDDRAPRAPGEAARCPSTDWLEANVIRREAEALLKEPRTK